MRTWHDLLAEGMSCGLCTGSSETDLIYGTATGSCGFLATMLNSEIERKIKENTLSPIILTKCVVKFVQRSCLAVYFRLTEYLDDEFDQIGTIHCQSTIKLSRKLVKV
jgi:hypothetical protein